MQTFGPSGETLQIRSSRVRWCDGAVRYADQGAPSSSVDSRRARLQGGVRGHVCTPGVTCGTPVRIMRLVLTSRGHTSQHTWLRATTVCDHTRITHQHGVAPTAHPEHDAETEAVRIVGQGSTTRAGTNRTFLAGDEGLDLTVRRGVAHRESRTVRSLSASANGGSGRSAFDRRWSFLPDRVGRLSRRPA